MSVFGRMFRGGKAEARYKLEAAGPERGVSVSNAIPFVGLRKDRPLEYLVAKRRTVVFSLAEVDPDGPVARRAAAVVASKYGPDAGNLRLAQSAEKFRQRTAWLKELEDAIVAKRKELGL